MVIVPRGIVAVKMAHMLPALACPQLAWPGPSCGLCSSPFQHGELHSLAWGCALAAGDARPQLCWPERTGNSLAFATIGSRGQGLACLSEELGVDVSWSPASSGFVLQETKVLVLKLVAEALLQHLSPKF